MVSAVLALSVAFVAAPTLAQTSGSSQPSEMKHRFNVPGGALDRAAVRFADQAGVQLVLDASIGSRIQVNPVRGELSTAQGLAQMLSGTGATWRTLQPGVITIERAAEGPRVIGAVRIEADAPEPRASEGMRRADGSEIVATEVAGGLRGETATIASRGAATPLKETPRAVSVLTAERLEQQGVTTVAGALGNAPGLAIANGPAGRTAINARGFAITSYRIDGGAPLSYAEVTDFDPFGSINIAAFDSVQVLRGPDSLFGGLGDPGGVVNLVRKRPLDQRQVKALVEIGGWRDLHLQADLSTPLDNAAEIRGRLVLDYQDRDFFYQSSHQENGLAYGVVEADLTTATTLRTGFSYARRKMDAPNAYGLPRYLDGADAHLPRSRNFSPPWAWSDLTASELFASLDHRFNNDWRVATNFTYSRREEPQVVAATEHLFVPDGVRSSLLTAVFKQDLPQTQNLWDITFDGRADLFGRKQAVTFGLDFNETSTNGRQAYVERLQPFDAHNFDPDSLGPRPTTYPNSVDHKWRRTQIGAFFNGRFSLTSRLSLLAGARITAYEHTARSVSVTEAEPTPVTTAASIRRRGVVTPSVSIVYALSTNYNLYATYADSLDPNRYAARDGGLLEPASGQTYEAGVKGSIVDGRVDLSLAYYNTAQNNVAVTDQAVGLPSGPGCCYLAAGRRRSRGIEMELVGEVAPGWEIQFSYSYNDFDLNDALLTEEAVATTLAQQPEHQLKLWTSYTLSGPSWDRWTFSGGVRYESERAARGFVCTSGYDSAGACSTALKPFTYGQPAYGVVDLGVAYRITPRLTASVLATNVGDATYYTSAGAPNTANFYGEPRAVLLSLRATY